MNRGLTQRLVKFDQHHTNGSNFTSHLRETDNYQVSFPYSDFKELTGLIIAALII